MISDKLKLQLGDWECLYPFFESDEWVTIKSQLKPDFQTITPIIDVWFRPFKECKYKDIKVLWLTPGPYHTKDSYTGENTADGLAFSTDLRHTVPNSLFNIYKGYEWDQHEGVNRKLKRSNDLTFLANQGVLLLNLSLTTIYKKESYHLEIWKPFIQYVLKTIQNTKPNVIFCGFGEVAKEYLTEIKETVLIRNYPKDQWKHDNIFSEIDKKLIKQKQEIIFWDKYYAEMEKAPW